MTDKIQLQQWGRQIDEVMSEITRQAAISQVRLLDPGVIDGVIANNSAVAGSNNPRSFKKLRDALMLGFMIRENSIAKMGPVETAALIDNIREQLKARMGGRLGG
jgi:hypothetical protein